MTQNKHADSLIEKTVFFSENLKGLVNILNQLKLAIVENNHEKISCYLEEKLVTSHQIQESHHQIETLITALCGSFSKEKIKQLLDKNPKVVPFWENMANIVVKVKGQLNEIASITSELEKSNAQLHRSIVQNLAFVYNDKVKIKTLL